MVYNRPRPSRRAVMKGIVSTGLATSHVIGSVSSKTSSKYISEDTAKTVAERMISFYSEVREDHRHWSDAVPGKPTLYYEQRSNKYRPAAYVFPVEKHHLFTDEVIGHITISANRQRPPVLEYGNTNPPSTKLKQTKEKINKLGANSTDRLLYQGGVDFGIQISDDEMINLRSQKRTPIRTSSEAQLLADKSNEGGVSTQWDNVINRSSVPESEYRSYRSEDLPRHFGYYAMDGHYGEGRVTGDKGDDGPEYPANRGMEEDPWGSWDGCNPIAGTQIIMYHEDLQNSSENVEEREKICDALHHLMQTTDGGDTAPPFYDRGFNLIDTELDFLSNDYSGENEHNISKDLIRNEIDQGRPFMLSNWKVPTGPLKKKKGNNYNGHAVVGARYHEGSTMEIDVYTGWETAHETIAYGTWDLTAAITKITP